MNKEQFKQPTKDFDRLVNTWERVYTQLGYKAGHAQQRKSELLTWDKPKSDNDLEHMAKIQACTNIINKANGK